MHKIDAFGATVDNQFTDGNPSLAVPATNVGAKWLNAVQGELAHLIEEAGIELDDEDNTQLFQAIAVLIAASAADISGKVDKAGDTMTGDLVVPSLNGGALAGHRNLLINGAFQTNRRAPATNADDTYAHDRWYALTQANAIAVSTLADAEDGAPSMARLTQSNASAQRMGYAQIIEGKNCRHLRGKQVTFRFGRFRYSNAAAVRFAVLEWTGTEDAVTSDVVNDWTSPTYTAGNFFLASNVTVPAGGVVANTPAAATLTDGPAVTVTLGSAFNNLIVLAWTEGTAASASTLDLGKAQFEQGSIATPFENRHISVERTLCERYFLSLGGVDLFETVAVGASQSATACTIPIALPVEMRALPTLTVSAAAHWMLRSAGSDIACTGLSGSNASPRCYPIAATVAAGLTSGGGAVLRANSTTAARLNLDAEL